MPASLDLQEGEQRDLVVTLADTAWIELEVVDAAGAPMHGWFAALAGDPTAEQSVAVDGRVRFDGLPPGSHDVLLRRQARGLPLCERRVVTNERTRLVVPPAALVGHRLRGTLGPADDVPLERLRVVLMRAAPSWPQPHRHEVAARIDPRTCGFAFDSLPAGRYHLQVGTAVEIRALRRDIHVTAADVELGEIALGVGSLELQVLEEDGRAVAASEFALDAGDELFVPFALEAVSGQQLRELPAASYRLLVWGRASEPLVVPVTVQHGKRTPVALDLRAASTVTLTFAGIDAPRGTLGRLALQRDGAPLVALVVDLGRPFVRGFAPGRYRAEVDAATGEHGTVDFLVARESSPTVVVRLAR